MDMSAATHIMEDNQGAITWSTEVTRHAKHVSIRICGISIADSTATTDTHGSTSDTYGRWNIASQRESWQLRTTRVRHPTDGRHDDVDTQRDDT